MATKKETVKKKKETTENKPYRKYDVCQECGGEFTDEHIFAKYCKKCRPPKDKVNYGIRVLEKDEYRVGFLEYFVSVTCKHCNREVDIVWNKTQPHEMVCGGCGRRYEPVFEVKEHTDKGVTTP